MEGATNSGCRSAVAMVVRENDARCEDDSRWFAAVVSGFLGCVMKDYVVFF